MTSQFDRRWFLKAGMLAAGGAGLAACSDTATPSYLTPTAARVKAAEARRRTGVIRDFRLTAKAGPVDLGGRTVRTWSYGGELPGQEIRVKVGEVVRARLSNDLPSATSVHWHGLALTNVADGVPGVTQPPIRAGGELVYEFTAPDPGTYWFHPHSGTQLDRGLYAPLIVEDPKEPLSYDDEWIVVLDDWLDGVTGTPEEVLAELRGGMPGMGGDMEGHDMHGGGSPQPSASAASGRHMMMGAASPLLGGDAGDVKYPYFLINGRRPAQPQTFRAKRGDRIRIRFINAGGDTAFRVALGGHRMTVTHTDGFPVVPVETEALLIGMGERYDVLVTIRDGAFPLVALAEGKDATARALLRSSRSADAPEPGTRPAELDGRIVGYDALKPAASAALPPKKPNRTLRLELTGGMGKYDWGINGRAYDPKGLYPVREGERVRLVFVNKTMMWHPMHLHGHTFALTRNGLRKDTAIVLPGKTLEMDFDAANPGRWMVHCHNIYHAEAGMMALLGYEA